jgi:hypothetical protein
MLSTQAAMGRKASAWGIDVTSAHGDAVTLFDGAVMDFLDKGGDPAGKCAAASDMDGGFVMAMVLEAFVLMLHDGASGRSDQLVQLRRRVEYLAEKRHCNFRERCFVAALHAWADGRRLEATAILEGWLLEQPQDVLAVRVLHGAFGLRWECVRTIEC